MAARRRSLAMELETKQPAAAAAAAAREVGGEKGGRGYLFAKALSHGCEAA